MEIEGHSQLDCIERSQSMFNRVSSEKPRSRLKVLLLDWWPNDDPVSSDVRPETAQGNCPTRCVENARSHLDRQGGFELHQG
jgi:hypothetical protein